MSVESWRLDTHEQTLILASENNRMPCVVYWGATLPIDDDIASFYHAHMIDVTGGMLDKNPDLSICPEARRSFPGQAGLILHLDNGKPYQPKFTFDKAEHKNNHFLKLYYTDKKVNINYCAEFHAFDDSNIITATASITSAEPIYVQWLAAPVMPASQYSDKMIDFAGRWCGEFQYQENQWNMGIRYRDNRTGRTGHEHFPTLIIPDSGANNCDGHVYGFHYGFSGGHSMIAEELQDGRRQIQFGHARNTEHHPLCHCSTAPLYLTFSSQGINGCARSFQRHVRQHIVKMPNGDKPRPVHYNCWEAVYFDHNIEELKEIATLAAHIGAERFVLDDGWFGTRDDDTRALSEWVVDKRKYPQGLQPLIDHIHHENMSFGIWFEPEMINPESSIYQQYPHWALGDGDQILGRQQMALNMALSEVQNFLFDHISAILAQYDIDYIKWDHNRVLPIADNDQIRGTYALIDHLRAEFPHIEIESCASGGGRIDFGILQRTHRIWLSDSNDALERVRVQHNAAYFLPAMITGSHVGPRHCHTSGRVHDMAFRAWVAAQRHIGFEMDPRELSDEEKEILINITQWWKSQRDWLMNADILHLDMVDNSIFAEQHLSENEQQFIVFINKIDTSRQIAPRPLRLTALEPTAYYKITLVNKDEIHKLSRGNILLKSENPIYSGQYLMNHGIIVPWGFPNQCWVIEGKKL